MMFRLWTILVLSLAAMLGGSVAPAQQPRTPRIVAVGDLHGDYSAWIDIARAAGLIDGRGRWAGGRTIFVQLGDVPDRGPDSLKIIRHLMELQREAPKTGGSVIALVGNHEAMNVIGDLRYVHPGEYAAFVDSGSVTRRDRIFAANWRQIARQYRQTDPAITDAAVRIRWLQATPLGWVEHRLAWKSKGEIGRWVERNPAVAIIQGTLFVHGGISAEYSVLPVNEINRRVAAALATEGTSKNSILEDPLGPLWYRGLVEREAGDTRPPIGQEVSTVLNAYGAKRIVVGHTPLLSGIAVLHQGRLIRIDTGNARQYGGRPSYLEIIGDRVVPHSVTRSAK
ncbi:MAG TPA: metallophosphoesterase [Sphingomicrobium sp.]|nr:metallophosphoesterase [Sphingomicrobium sp.]